MLNIADFDLNDTVGYENTKYFDRCAGFASFYLQGCLNQLTLKNEADKEIFTQLSRLDSKLGTKDSEQLYKCVKVCPRLEIIQV